MIQNFRCKSLPVSKCSKIYFTIWNWF